MIFKSPVFSQASGSIAGLVYSRNGGGMYVRSRANPTNPNTDAQQAVRDALRILVNKWTTELTDSQRESWNNYAFNTPTLNRLGEPTHKTGQQMFLRGNVTRLQASLPIASEGPTIFDTGNFLPLGAITADHTSQEIEVAFIADGTWDAENNSALLIYQSRPQNPTRTFGKGPFQLATKIVGNSTTPPTSPATFTSLFPFVADQKIFLQARISRVDGRLSGRQNPSVLTT